MPSVAVDGSNPTEIRNGVASALQQNPDVEARDDARAGCRRAGADGDPGGRQAPLKLATFDISPSVLEAVQNGDILFAIDQQMYLQTYMSVLSLVTWAQYRLRPVTAVPSGPLFVDADNAAEIIELSAQGIH